MADVDEIIEKIKVTHAAIVGFAFGEAVCQLQTESGDLWKMILIEETARRMESDVK